MEGTPQKYFDPFRTTVRRALPYEFRINIKGKVSITNLRGQVIIVTHDEIVRHLERTDLDVHRRRLYEAALDFYEREKPS